MLQTETGRMPHFLPGAAGRRFRGPAGEPDKAPAGFPGGKAGKAHAANQQRAKVQELEAGKYFNEQEKEVLIEFRNHIEALIRKDRAAIEAFLAPSFQLIHMTGKV